MLTPTYDQVSTAIVMPEDTEETALTLNGKKSNLKRKDFLTFADIAGLNNKAATHMIDSVVRRKEEAIRMCRESYLNSELKKGMIALIEERSDRLQRLIR